ncbi:MAG: ribonuclease D, partial [Alphaproteobacteria bacterium]|nr:ribonuclease D [Alphaproteobacteria bacterium]
MITTTEELKEVCQRFATHSFVTIDTEFLREYTFYSKLCLIQAASVEEAVLIDPLAKGLDLTPFFELLQNQNVVKVFHSGRQDIEIFYNMTKKVPFPVFDTQIAAMVLGYGDCVGYQQLVSDLLHIEIDKGMRVTDWSKRPLSEAQLQYALSDVTYLRDVYLMVKEKVEKQQRLSWIEEEMNELYDANLYEPSNEK